VSRPVLVQSKLSVTQLTYKKFLCFKYNKKTIDDGINGSIERLKKENLDVYLLHAPSNGFEKYWGDLLRFKEQGKAKVVGVCRFDEKQLQIIKNQYGGYPAINQIEVHPFHTNKRLIEFCKSKGIAVEARTLLTHGDALNEFLSNDTLVGIAYSHKKTVPQVIIRWVVQQGVIAIVKSENNKHIKENIEVFDFCLDNNEMALIDSLNKDQSFGCVSSKNK
jgi:diketogulonate reductase-like aldo/keto reductase